MQVGTVIIKYCNNCPLYGWRGESRINGDNGWGCSFGAFDGWEYREQQCVPTSCPFRQQREEKRLLLKELEEVRQQMSHIVNNNALKLL